MGNIVISVIMGIFNPQSKEQLFASVQSVISQSYSNWELLICDDGSEEEHSNWILESAGFDRRITYIKNEYNRGLAYSLNRCIEISKGKYIARMDADDISQPDRLEKLLDFLESEPGYQWVGSNAELINETGVWGKGIVPEIPEPNDFLKYSPYIHPSVMFYKKLLIDNGGYMVSDETWRCEDYELFMRLHKKGFRGYNLQEELIQYREDHYSYKKRKYIHRISEARIRYRGFRSLGILKLKTAPYIVRPLVGGLIIPDLMAVIRKNAGKYNV